MDRRGDVLVPGRMGNAMTTRADTDGLSGAPQSGAFALPQKPGLDVDALEDGAHRVWQRCGKQSG